MGLSKKSLEKLSWVHQVVDEFREYLPLTVRQIYYQLVGKDLIENNQNSYKRTCELIKNARMEGLLDWNVVEDRTRIFNENNGFDNTRDFIQNECEIVLKGYKRDLMQNQPCYIEIWIEKDALSTIFQRIANQYTIPLMICKGYSSVTFLNNYYKRAINRNQPLVILYYGDFDPSGQDMPRHYREHLSEKGLDVKVEMGSLNYNQILHFNLPNNPDALKINDKRSKEFIKKHGHISVELDAMKPGDLQSILINDIETWIDSDEYELQVEMEYDDLAELDEKRNDAVKYLLTI